MTAGASAATAVVAVPLRLGTRRSALALAQARGVSELLAALGARSELIEVTTDGDASARAIAELGGTGVFVSALRDRLLANDTDLAVHSLKDLPTAPADGLVIAAIPVREDPRDVVVSTAGRRLDELPAGARVGTGSPRRRAQLWALGLPIEVVPVRGNVDTRLRAVADGDLDAVVVARAGLARLGRLDAVAEVLEPDRMLPAPGQGALAVECRAEDAGLRQLLERLDDPATRTCVTAERAVLSALRAGCTAPVGAHATLDHSTDDNPLLRLEAVVASDVASYAAPHVASDVSPPEGVAVRLSAIGSPAAPEELGRRLAADLLGAGAAVLLGERP